ncbi:MAG: hypothetical protein ACFFBC_10860 [Promethearchaeota archaeon]
MENKLLRIILIIFIVIGLVITAILWSMVDYNLSYWPPYSERGFAFIGYSAVIESIILFIIPPILYLLNLKKKKGLIEEKEKTGYCKSYGAEILDKTGEFCSKCEAPLT